MDQSLTAEEQEQLQDALQSAFRSQLALAEMVFSQLGNVRLDTIAPGETYGEVVANLVVWAQSTDQIDALVQGARIFNSRNICLRAFADQYHEIRDIRARNALSHKMYNRLANLLFRIPACGDFEGRTTLVFGIPYQQSLNRDTTNAITDLKHILNSLNQLGQLDSGAWPLLIVIENALSNFGPEYALYYRLKNVGIELAQAYGVQWEPLEADDRGASD